MKNLLRFLRIRTVEIIILLIAGYQKIFSPDHGILNYYYGVRRCCFYPSCSDYAVKSLRQYGLLRGIMVSLKRITRCHPWSAGGYDPVGFAKEPRS